jgi:hypothetical protein
METRQPTLPRSRRTWPTHAVALPGEHADVDFEILAANRRSASLPLAP